MKNYKIKNLFSSEETGIHKIIYRYRFSISNFKFNFLRKRKTIKDKKITINNYNLLVSIQYVN